VIVRIGTRGSQLALWQARTVAAGLEAHGAVAEIVVIRTSGDRIGEAAMSEASVSDAGGKRLFVREIEEALLDGRVDVAVHSTKDMPTDMPEGLTIAAVLPREEPWDALILPSRTRARDASVSAVSSVASLDAVLQALGQAPRLGTSSVRRITQLHRLLPDATFEPIRGNVDTRLRKLDAGQHDAIVLACAGLLRLGLGARISARLPVTVSVPAPGQGAVAVQMSTSASSELAALAARLDDRATRAAITAERMVVQVLGGGCQTPIGALALPHGEADLELHAAVTSFEGAELRAVAFGALDDPAALGERVGARLLSEGAAELLDASAVDVGDDH
jgi:hydroxymethylbilane synthase